ncbi:hypothetical protein GCM10009745_84550 [Kribbella yunnanensis]|uniref:DUF2188 domain-containing protein n=1 Tax=Kribbella yunnanensis TaxID=190194 RepID=A0ABN2JCL5_9ACTN
MLYEVTYTSTKHDAPNRTVTDAAGVTDLVRQAAATGSRVHIRPLSETGDHHVVDVVGEVVPDGDDTRHP